MFNTENLVKNALADTLKIPDISTIALDQSLKNDLQLDSMSSLMFLMKLEESIDGFYVDPETLQMEDLQTVSTVIHYVNTQLNAREMHVH